MKKILIVEDDDFLLLTLIDNLAKEGFKIIKARNGQEGLEVALREHPDLILLDIILPVMGMVLQCSRNFAKTLGVKK